MTTQNLILIEKLCTHYGVELSFIKDLSNVGLIEIVVLDQTQFIYQDKLSDLEKMIRLYDELELNLEGVDIVFNLLQKVETLQSQLNAVNNRLRLYEND